MVRVSLVLSRLSYALDSCTFVSTVSGVALGSQRCATDLCTFCPPRHSHVSYHLYYLSSMAIRQKRSISLPPELAEAIDHAAALEGTSVSAWLADTAAHRLRLDAGRAGIAEWERKNGTLIADELAEGLARARTILRSSAPSRQTA